MTSWLVSPWLVAPWLVSPWFVPPWLVVAVVALAVPVATALAVRWGALPARPRSARRNVAWFVLVGVALLVAPGGLGPGAVALSVALVALFEGTLAGLRSGGRFRNHFR